MSKIDHCTVPFAPVYDVHVDLIRLRGIAAALAYLTSPVHLKEDDDFDIFHESLMEITDRLDRACGRLKGAILEMKEAEDAKR